MTYSLGIDLGTTYSSAAVCEPGARPRPVKLGDLSDSVPTVIFARPEGHLFGEIAELRGPSDPTLIIRNVKLRLGSDTPIVAGGSAHDPTDLVGEYLAWLVERTTRLRGAPPDRVALTHPAHWGSYRLDRLAAAAARAGQPDPVFLSEPEAAGVSYVSSEKIEVERLVGVYDFGGGTFDAAVIRRTPRGFALQGKPSGVDTIGGNVFDGLIFRFVSESLGGKELAETDEAFAAVQALRDQCRVAKRVLSDDTSADVPVLLPGASTSIRVTRADFEDLIERHVAESVAIMQTVINSAGVDAADLDSVLMVGGSSRIPLVSQMLGRAIGCPLAFDIEPKMSVAMGAAIVGARELERLPSLSPVGAPLELQPLVGQNRTAVPSDERAIPPAPSDRDWDGAPSVIRSPGGPGEESGPTALSEVASESSHYVSFVPTPVSGLEPVAAKAEEIVLPPSKTDWWTGAAAGAALTMLVSYLLLKRLDVTAFWLVVGAGLWWRGRITTAGKKSKKTESKEIT